MDMFTHAIYLIDGRIAEYCTIPELMALRGHYYRRVQQNEGVKIDNKGRAVITPDRTAEMWLFGGVAQSSLVNLAESFAMRVLPEGAPHSRLA